MYHKLNIQKKIARRRQHAINLLKDRILEWMAYRFGHAYTKKPIEDWAQWQWKGMFSIWVKYHKRFQLAGEPEDHEYILDYFL